MRPLDPLAVPLHDTTLIEASAGTGKTWTLATLYLRLLVERELQVGQILVVTYTNAATAELRDRIRRRLREAVAFFEQALAGEAPSPAATEAGDEPLAHLVAWCRAAGSLARMRKHLLDALRGFDEAAIFTIHGFCQRILLENAFESGVMFDAELVTDERPLCSEVVKDFWVQNLHDAPSPLIAHLQRKQTPEQLEKLARKVLASRDMPILPEEAVARAHAELDAAIAELRAAALPAIAAWERDASQVRKLLSPLVLKHRYKADAIDAWCRKLTTYLAQSPERPWARFDELENFTSAVLARCTRSAHTTPKHPFFSLCDRLLAARDALDDVCRRHALALQGALVRHVGDEVRRRHEAANTQSFDDLLYRLRDALRAAGGALLARQIRDRFHAALIDEFQDTDPVQYEIFRRIYFGTGAPLFLIGDPKQAIYAFRGADVFTYVGAKRDAGENAHTLQVNHRSAPALVTAVNTLFRRVRAPFVFAEIPFAAVTPAAAAREPLQGAIAERPPLEILHLRPSAEEAARRPSKAWANRHAPEVVAADVVRLLASGATIGARALHAGDVAVLCRTNRQATAVQEALRRRGVPSVRQGDDSVFESDEAEELERVLRAVAEPGDPRLLRAALATRLVGVDAHELEALQRDETGWDAWAGRFHAWLEAWTQQGFMAAFRRLLEACGTQRRLLATAEGERRLTNVLHLAELLQAASREAHRGPLALVDWLDLLRNDPAARAELASEAAQIRLESDEKAVKLVTIHRSKGLEYGVVYCPYTWDGSTLSRDDRQWVRFHDADDDGVLKLDLGSPDQKAHLERAELEGFAENLRLLYVALTRARHRCVLVWSDVGSDERAPLGYLLHQSHDGDQAEEIVVRTQARLKTLEPGERRADLDALAADSLGSIAIRDVVVPEPESPSLLAAEAARPAGGLQLAQARRTLDRSWRVSSFSGLVASGGRTSHQAEEGLDHDAAPALADQATRDAAAAERVVLHDLPAGARTGEMLHAILERIDFQRGERDQLAAEVRAALGAYGFEERWANPIAHAIGEVLATPIDDGTMRFTLADVARERRLDEMQFLFEVGAGFDRDRLARCFERHPTALRGTDYGERVRRLAFDELRGFLGGFIDLVFEHGGRWYVVDYKSNFLGPGPSAYAPERLARAMSLHHYHLQAHLYALAVHRYLTLRLPGYDYARDFGGIAYLFLRGMSPHHPAGCGIHLDRPAASLLDDLAALVGDGARGAER